MVQDDRLSPDLLFLLSLRLLHMDPVVPLSPQDLGHLAIQGVLEIQAAQEVLVQHHKDLLHPPVLHFLSDYSRLGCQVFLELHHSLRGRRHQVNHAGP